MFRNWVLEKRSRKMLSETSLTSKWGSSVASLSETLGVSETFSADSASSALPVSFAGDKTTVSPSNCSSDWACKIEQTYWLSSDF